MVSTDRNIFLEGSSVRVRMAEYASLVTEMNVIVFTKRSSGFKKTQIAPNAWAYPTNSFSRWLYPISAYFVATKYFSPKIDENINLITTQDPFETGIAGFWIAKKLRAPLHLQVHTDFLSNEFSKESALNRFRVRIAKFLIKKHPNIRVVSERIKTSIFSKMKFRVQPRITILPVFVDVLKYQNASAGNFLREKYQGFHLIMLAVSRLEKEKNLELAIKLVADAGNLNPNDPVALVIVGSGSEESGLKKLARKLGVENQVFFEGWIDDLRPYYTSADLLLVTSKYEGYGMIFAEATAAGCPVLAADVGAAREILSTWNGILCEEGDQKCFLENILRLASDLDARIRLLGTARGAASRLVFKTKEEYLAEYRKMLESAALNEDFR